MPFDAARNATETNILSLKLVSFDPGFGRHGGPQLFAIQTVEDDVARGFGQLLPRLIQREPHGF